MFSSIFLLLFREMEQVEATEQQEGLAVASIARDVVV